MARRDVWGLSQRGLDSLLADEEERNARIPVSSRFTESAYDSKTVYRSVLARAKEEVSLIESRHKRRNS